MQDLDYRKQQLKKLQSQVIDLEDVQGNITITDLTFNDFKMDLEKSTEQELEVLNHIPTASYALVKSNMSNIEKGVIFCLKDTSEEYGDKLRNNIIYPYFLVYVSMNGREVVKASNAKQTLDYFRKLGMGNEKILPELIKDFRIETRHDKNMKQYRDLLQIAIDDIIGVKDEIGLDSLATPGGTSFTASSLSKKEDLKLIAWLIIK